MCQYTSNHLREINVYLDVSYNIIATAFLAMIYIDIQFAICGTFKEKAVQYRSNYLHSLPRYQMTVAPLQKLISGTVKRTIKASTCIILVPNLR